MKFLLKLKHWQLFLLTWGIPIIWNVVMFSQPELFFQLFPFLMVLFILGTMGWVWAIATELNHLLPFANRFSAGWFKVYFSFPILYITGIILYMMFIPNPAISEGVVMLIWFLMHLLSIAFIFMGMRFAAKTLKSVELGRVAKFGDYAGEFFLIWFSIIGYWILQPRLNKLIKN